MQIQRVIIIVIFFFSSAFHSSANEILIYKKQRYVSSVVPQNMTINEKKLRFRYFVQNLIEEVYSELIYQYNEVLLAIIKNRNSDKLNKLKTKYKVQSNKELLAAIKPHPKSIAIAQAAIESAWGTSRFFRYANNVFGIWSFNKNEPRIAASRKRYNKPVWIKKYDSIKESISDYYLLLARGRAFSNFRKLKMKTSDPYQLVKKLDSYSEKKSEYSKNLAAIIRYNKFYKLDQ